MTRYNKKTLHLHTLVVVQWEYISKFINNLYQLVYITDSIILILFFQPTSLGQGPSSFYHPINHVYHCHVPHMWISRWYIIQRMSYKRCLRDSDNKLYTFIDTIEISRKPLMKGFQTINNWKPVSKHVTNWHWLFTVL